MASPPIGRRSSHETSAKAITFADLAPADRKFEFKATQKEPEVVLQIREAAQLLNVDKSDFAREAVRAAYERVMAGQPIRGEIDRSLVGTDRFSAPYLAAVPCGPWQEAIESGFSFAINREVADEMEAQEGDVFIRASGESMEGLGIQDGFLVLVRPYKIKAPRRGDLVLVQAFTGESEEAVLGTLKQFEKMVGGLPLLLDGEGNEFELPEGTVKVQMLARAVGVLGRI